MVGHQMERLKIEVVLGLEGTKRMFCRATASAMASASRKSFLFDFEEHLRCESVS
jgi:hypothetical protein